MRMGWMDEWMNEWISCFTSETNWDERRKKNKMKVRMVSIWKRKFSLVRNKLKWESKKIKRKSKWYRYKKGSFQYKMKVRMISIQKWKLSLKASFFYIDTILTFILFFFLWKLPFLYWYHSDFHFHFIFFLSFQFIRCVRVACLCDSLVCILVIPPWALFILIPKTRKPYK